MGEQTRLKISKHDDETILVEALEGIDHFGFGTFLCDIKPEQIECDAFSLNAILSSRYKHGLNGMEIWSDNRIAWGDPDYSILIPISEISKQDGAEQWLRKINVA